METQQPTPVQALYHQRKAEAGEGQGDYHALDQGVERTRIRHETVISKLGHLIENQTVWDIGCGTGLILDAFADVSMLPKAYFGTDIMDRTPELFARADKYGLLCDFLMTPGGPPPKYLKANVALCIGITGFWGMHTYGACTELYKVMFDSSLAGAIVFPRFYDPSKMGDPYLTRFDHADMTNYLRAYSGREPTKQYVVELEREFFLIWEK